MPRLVHTIGMLAALVAVLVSLGRDYGLLVALKRAIVSYLAFFFVASLLALVFRSGVLAEGRRQAPPGGKAGTPPADEAPAEEP